MNVETPELTPKLTGEYRVELEVLDDAGRRSCKPHTMTLDVRPRNDIYVELTWSTPGDPNEKDAMGSDLDLHFSRYENWMRKEYAVWSNNRTADWGQSGRDRDDPKVLRTDDDGLGPEAVELNGPIHGDYSVGVHFVNDGGFGRAEAHVKIYRNRRLGEGKGWRLMGDFSRVLNAGSFWYVAEIDWPRDSKLEGKDQVYKGGIPN